jgi:hypothetical protein
LYELVFDEFFKEYPNLRDACISATDDIEEACSKSNQASRAESVMPAHSNLLQVLSNTDMLNLFQTWVTKRSQHAMFKSLMNYLHRVETILFFVAASRNTDLTLHLEAGEALSKLFFAFDRIKYKRLWPRYIADMYALKQNHPDTWQEFETENIAVTKNDIPFTSIGADHACEHLNKMMKVHSGLIGISNNANARQRFFLAAPELSRLSREFKCQFDLQEDKVRDHHGIGASAVKHEHTTIDKIKAAILTHGNPFAAEGDMIYNIISLAYVPQESVPQILDVDERGQTLYEEYVKERINGEVSLWAPVKREKNKMYTSGNKKTTVRIRDKAVDLKETKDLYARLMILAKSSRDIDLKYSIGNFEFTLTPRALFAPCGSVLQCTDKSKLIKLLTDLPQTESTEDSLLLGATEATAVATAVATKESSRRIAVVDGMVLVQKLAKKPATIVTVNDLSKCFNDRLMSLTAGYDEIILVFDTYQADSLKNTTREKRRHGKDPIRYQVKDDTSIKHIPMTRFFSHAQTKNDLAQYLAEKTIEYNKDSSTLVIASASGQTISNRSLHFENNNHEEADTLMIYHAICATQRNLDTAELVIFSPDTDVLVLAIAYYDNLPKNTSISMVSGTIKLRPIWKTLGMEKVRALPAFHAFTGADNIGRFSRIGKSTWLKLFLKADSDVIDALINLSRSTEVTDELLSTLAKFVCAAYCPKSIRIENIPELRWHLFCKQLADSESLPPTIGALKQHVLRVQVQANVWGQADISHHVFLDPLQNGYYKETGGQLKAKTTDVLPAPKSLIEMVRCQCKSNCSSHRCSCKSRLTMH